MSRAKVPTLAQRGSSSASVIGSRSADRGRHELKSGIPGNWLAALSGVDGYLGSRSECGETRVEGDGRVAL